MEHEEESRRPGARKSGWGRIAMLDKTKEFFQTCDVEGRGFITRTDMRRLPLPLSAEELEDVFDSLDTKHTGYLTLEAFSSGFSQFLHGRRISVTDEPAQTQVPGSRAKEAFFQSQWEAKLSGGEDEEEGHFCLLLDSLGASNVFEDPDEVRSLWAQLRRDEPHLLSNFEEFLARVTHQIKEAHQDKKDMESALQRKAATHDNEIRHLYEEMEAQIKTEKDRLLLKDSERLQSRSQDLEDQLFSKERELELIFQKQKRLELECRELSSEKQESHVENVKLKMTNDELARALESTSQELLVAQDQLAMLQEQAARLHQEKEMEMYRVTEGLQREKQSLMKQLDLLREMNKHLKDERDICSGVPRTSLRKKQKQRAGLADMFDDSSQPAKRSPLVPDGSYQSLEALPIEHLQIVFVASSSCSEDDAAVVKKSAGLANGYGGPALPKPHNVRAKGKKAIARSSSFRRTSRERSKKLEAKADEVLDSPPGGWPLRRVISIEEDHLPHLLQGGPQLLLHQLSEEEDGEARSDLECSLVKAGRFFQAKKKTPMSPRGQPVGKETQHVAEVPVLGPSRLFKVVLVGNSSVGKTSLLRSFCEGHFHPSTTATVGIDFSVKTLTLNNMQIAMQLWDTAGQERYRSITKQFFRKADGVVVMYDVTLEESFKAVRPWLANVKDAAGEGVQILVLGNKMDMDGDREVSFKEAERLAQESKVMFYEVSAYTGKNVTESLTHLARVLMEQEDRVRDTTVILSAHPLKKKACCK
ncbi:EF-hand calcium-binding domain-containing protein 4B isoform X1 [Syngnathus typhle]|uniref:EF-hand calcium-binding domain-containing protein 4B isoform X1 n=1 Tax=Syngnathus typhle TaxID=161592 RepID=UPI002A6B0B13|nr:EF-hand calcium-binding domain-containing protein 4B isoform X1 [Syngnathus typhle]XP_061124823.1 EF-hand calcium-binding domain-containing protein 4B isoform X1 [Syngnathus typhle]XP_061124824.1 EF-hand calcium-binding domain-containing protein 4B isoform X1 [Syngnathus typhle]XP_061124825.1 EF-hand calcium-binding domain-containing protein 4B isoform X1 [Syngnathus typhle]